MALDLKPISEPTMDIQLPDGQTKSYPLFEIFEKIETAIRDIESFSTAAQSEAIRKAMDLPGISSYHAHYIYEHVLAKVKELEITKKLSALTQN